MRLHCEGYIFARSLLVLVQWRSPRGRSGWPPIPPSLGCVGWGRVEDALGVVTVLLTGCVLIPGWIRAACWVCTLWIHAARVADRHIPQFFIEHMCSGASSRPLWRRPALHRA